MLDRAGGVRGLPAAPASPLRRLIGHESQAIAHPTRACIAAAPGALRAQIESGGVTHEHTRKWLYLQELQVGPPPLLCSALVLCCLAN